MTGGVSGKSIRGYRSPRSLWGSNLRRGSESRWPELVWAKAESSVRLAPNEVKMTTLITYF